MACATRPAFLAGLSAGGALASLLALRDADAWAGVAIHAGLPFAAASDPWGALGAMKDGPPDLAPARALHAASPTPPGVPALIVHGAQDTIVARRNAELLVRQFLGWNGHLADAAWEAATLPAPAITTGAVPDGHEYAIRDWRRTGLAPVRELEVLGMGHAWTGGDSAVPFHDERGPDGTALMLDFFAAVRDVSVQDLTPSG